MSTNQYSIFPFGQVERGAKVVIYGAGRAGKNFFCQVKNTQYCDVIYMVDQNFKNITVYGIEVKPAETLLCESEYDYCVISLIDRSLRSEIYNMLIDLGLPEHKIILPEDNIFDWFWNGFPDAQNEFNYGSSFEGFFKQCDARKFISSQRIDIGVRYLLFKDFINRYENNEHMSLYSRYMFARSGGKSMASFHSENSKESIKDFIKQGKELCESIVKNGFDPNRFIPMNDSGEALDGLHRIAAAIVTGDMVWAREYSNMEQGHVSLSFFDRTGFNAEDKIRLMRAFTDTYPGECAIAVLFAPVADMWTFIEAALKKQVTIVGSVTLDFNDNYVAFENIIHEMYDDAVFINPRIHRKLDTLKMSPLLIRVILLSDEKIKNCDVPFYEMIKSVKLSIRDSLVFDVESVPVVMHAPDDRDENTRLKHIVLSVNNLRYARKKFTQQYSLKFISMLNAFKRWCFESSVPITDTCIVGSAPMTVFGIRESKDIDFTLLTIHRERFANENEYKISDTLEIVKKDFATFEKSHIISDETLIGDDNLYFWFYGCKFVNLDILRKKKEFLSRDKDIEDIRLLDLQEDLEFSFDNKTTLRKQIEREIAYRRMYML